MSIIVFKKTIVKVIDVQGVKLIVEPVILERTTGFTADVVQENI